MSHIGQRLLRKHHQADAEEQQALRGRGRRGLLDRQVKGGEEDCMDHRKGADEGGADEYTLGLIAIPNGRNGAHHLLAVRLVAVEREEDADRQIKASDRVDNNLDHRQRRCRCRCR